MPELAKGSKCSLIRIAAYCIVFSRILFYKIIVNAVAGVAKSFASFATFVPFLLLSEAMMLYSFHNEILLLLFNILHTAPPKVSIKLTTAATIPILYSETHVTIFLDCY